MYLAILITLKIIKLTEISFSFRWYLLCLIFNYMMFLLVSFYPHTYPMSAILSVHACVTNVCLYTNVVLLERIDFWFVSSKIYKLKSFSDEIEKKIPSGCYCKPVFIAIYYIYTTWSTCLISAINTRCWGVLYFDKISLGGGFFFFRNKKK